ncbi:Glutamate receptor 2.8, partial [Cucurbita argyrosperma subsp. argyrosperma]
MENGVLQDIENKWFKSNISSPDPNSLISTTLGLESFWGLFLLSGAVSLSAVIIALARFVHERRHDFNLSTDSMWKRFLLLMKNFDQKDHTSPAFRRNSRDENQDEGRDESREAHPSPSCDSNY